MENNKNKLSPRHRAREFALQGLYQWYLAGQDQASVVASVHELEAFHKADQEFCLLIIDGVIFSRDKYIDNLAKYIEREVSELSAIEACILLMANFELSEMIATPYRVIINEYVELTKTFGGAEAHKFVNGVLDKLASELRQNEKASNKSSKLK